MTNSVTAIAFVLLGLTVGCGDTGTVRISLTDAPLVGVSEVNVTVSSVEVHQPGNDGDDGGWTVVSDEELSFDLLMLQDGVRATLGETTLPTGRINQIRLFLSDEQPPVIVDAEGEHVLTIPSARNTGIKLVGCFRIEAGESTDITLDFDAAASVHTSTTGTYVMRPTVKILERGTCKGGGAPDTGGEEPPVYEERAE